MAGQPEDEEGTREGLVELKPMELKPNTKPIEKQWSFWPLRIPLQHIPKIYSIMKWLCLIMCVACLQSLILMVAHGSWLCHAQHCCVYCWRRLPAVTVRVAALLRP